MFTCGERLHANHHPVPQVCRHWRSRLVDPAAGRMITRAPGYDARGDDLQNHTNYITGVNTNYKIDLNNSALSTISRVLFAKHMRYIISPRVLFIQPGLLSNEHRVLFIQSGTPYTKLSLVFTNFRMLSPKPGVLSLKPGVQSLKPGVLFPKPGVLSPKPDVLSTELHLSYYLFVSCGEEC